MTGAPAPDPARALSRPAGAKAPTDPTTPVVGTIHATSASAPPIGSVADDVTEDPLVADARRVLGDWESPAPTQDDLRARYLAFLEAHPDAASRDLRAGHLTASTVVLDAARRRVLLTLHPLAGRWFQLGGHVESADGTMAAAALREATEESGIDGLDLHPTLIGLDWHPTRCRDSARALGLSSHLDFEYVAVAPPGAEHLRSAESLDLAWFALDALPDGADDVVRALIRRVRDLGLA